MLKKVRDYIISQNMLKVGEQVIAAVSGGADSICLLHILVKLQEDLHMAVSAVHVHHGIRGGEADRDAAYTEELCGRLGVPCLVVHKNVPAYAAAHGMSAEEAGRLLRYEAFEKEASRLGGAKIAVAHHSGDQTETILHNLFRGSSLRGIGGMSPVRGAIIRPLLTCSRREILLYLEEREIVYCEDSTNESADYTRNRLRNIIIPEIVSGVNQRAAEHILHAGSMIAKADAYIKREAARKLEAYMLRRDGNAGIGIEVLLNQDGIIRTYMILEMMNEVGGSRKDITARHVASVEELLQKEVGARVDLPYALTSRRTYDELWIEHKNLVPPVDKCGEMDLPEPIFTRFSYEKHEEIPENRYTKWFDYDRIEGMLSVRTRQTGDYITLRDGKRKTVKSYMIDEKIPRELRERIPLLADGSHILWIVGYRISEYYKITGQTKQILQVQMLQNSHAIIKD